jgi:hypothetical protein
MIWLLWSGMALCLVQTVSPKHPLDPKGLVVMALIRQLLPKIPEFWKFQTTTISKLFHSECSQLVWILPWYLVS